METKEKKQVLNAIGKASNILVTVGVSPNVDELAALLGLTLVLSKLDKHATAIFSGQIPSAISFLEPGKTFEDTVDGLRDFIIALNKEKADHLRYKLDGDVVKIFITPYKNTIIRDTDLEFSQGDFNVDLVIALGVDTKTDLDIAVASHGRILHDSTTVSISVGSVTSELGEIVWHAASASSLCEMLVSLSRDLGDDLIDERIATAFMTGIVSGTDRFSNNLTTSDVMKTAASLMASGANQQLIAAQLDDAEEHAVHADAPAPIREDVAPAPKPAAKPAANDGAMQIDHDAKPPEEPEAPAAPDADTVLQDQLDKVIPVGRPDLPGLDDITPEETKAPQEPEAPHIVSKASGYVSTADNAVTDSPSTGGTLNATAEQAEEDNRAAYEDERNHVILSHNAPPAEIPGQPAPAATEEPAKAPATPAPAPQPALPSPSADLPPVQAEPVDDALAELGYAAGSKPTLAELDQKTGHNTGEAPAASTAKPVLEVDDARAAVATALDSAFTPANNPAENVGSQPLAADVHDAPAPQAPTALDLPPLPPLPGEGGALPPLPPLPDLGELDAHAGERAPAADSASVSTTDWEAHTVEPPAHNDPNQFRIPGQK